MYGIQGLWTAARYNLPVTFVICNNAQYQILKVGAQQIGLPAARSGRFVGMDLAEPEIDFVNLAQSLGVKALRSRIPTSSKRGCKNRSPARGRVCSTCLYSALVRRA